jgi:hypothetical protein
LPGPAHLFRVEKASCFLLPALVFLDWFSLRCCGRDLSPAKCSLAKSASLAY